MPKCHSKMDSGRRIQLEKTVATEIEATLYRTGSTADKLAQQVVNLGTRQPDEQLFVYACQTFGRFDPKFLGYVHRTIWSTEEEEATDVKDIKDINIRREPDVKLEIRKPNSFSKKINLKTKDEDSLNSSSNDSLSKFKLASHRRTRERDDLKSSGLSEIAKQRLAEIRQSREMKNSRREKEESRDVEHASDSAPTYTSPRHAFRKRKVNLNASRSQFDLVEYKEDPESQVALERDWYTQDEFGNTAGEDAHNPFYSGTSAFEDEVAEAEMEAKVKKRMTALAAQKQKDSDKWEQNRMQNSGVLSLEAVNEDFNEDESRTHLFVHSLTPPFLDGHQTFTRQKDPISAVRDPQSNLAVFAKKGSRSVQERRQRKEREKQTRAATSTAGTTLGNVLGIREDEDEYQQSSSGNKFSEALKNQSKPTGDFSSKKTLKEQRQFLPAFAVREELLKVIRDNQVTIIVGETGSGKTTQLTQYLYEDGYGSRGLIGCTQPRRVAAMSVAKRVSEEMEVELGQEVGYAIRFEDYTSRKTIIKYMTYGILLQETLVDPDLSKYSCIIMDEAHERALNTDVLLGLFKNILSRRRDIKLIVTSATMNADRFSQFYGGAPQFTIPGRTFPVEVLHHSSPVEDYVDAAVKQVLSIHLQSGPGDILVFMTGQEDIEATCEILSDKLKLIDNPEPLEILPIFSQMPADLQAKIFQPAPAGIRKVVVATNIAETSLTVDGIRFVVDSGYCKMKVYNPKFGMDALQVTPISQANASQRSGRAGRTSKGVAYRLYTERAEVEEMYPQTIPEIQRSNLAHTLLLLKSLGVDDLLDFNFLDPPPMDTMTTSLYDLWSLGALNNIGGLTPLGKKMASFPIDPYLSKLIITSVEYGCCQEMLTIVSMLSVPSVFYRPKERQEESDSAREKFFVPESDHLTLLHIFNQWNSNGRSDGWSGRHFLHARALRRAQEVRDQLQYILENQGTRIVSCGGDWDIIRKCICGGYFHQAARVKGLGEYVNLRTNITMQLHPTSALYGQGYLPDYVIYHELVLTSKQFMSIVTAVDPYWLADLGGVFYSIKEKGYSNRDKKNTEVEYSQRAELEASIERDRKIYEESKQNENDRAWRKKIQQSAVVLPGRVGRNSARRGV